MKYLNLLFLLMTLSVITGCSDDTEQFIVPGTGDGISVNYRVEGEMALSRSVPTTQHERTLEHVHVLFFDAENEAYQGYTRATVVAGKTTFSLDPPENLDLNKKYKVLAIGNGDDYLDGTYETMSAKLETLSGTLVDVKKQLTAIHSANITSKSVAALPLWGIFTDKDGGESSFTVTEEGGVRKVAEAENAEFLFSRAICRVDIHNLVGHLLDIRYARIANNRTAGYYFADGLNAGNVAEMNSAVTDPSTSDLYMPITADVTDEKTTQMLEASLYTFPNIVTTTAQNDKATTCLLIAGYYINPETGDKDDKLTFYRFNLANVGESQTLQRNYAYRATIKGVKRRGKENEKDAYNDNVPIFEYDVDDEWDATDDNVVSDKDGNFLIVNKTHFTFNGEASEADFVELRVSTNPELEWTVEPVNRDNQENDKFIFKKISNNAVQVGPKTQNNTDYVRYGYYKIVARSSTIKTPLEMYIYMVQLSMKDNVRMLTVNDCTGEIDQKISPDGGNISLKVVTGSKFNNWATELHGEDVANWSSDAFYTKEGTNNSYLTINIPAHIGSETRTTRIEVYLVDETQADGKDANVKPVYINISQEPTTSWLSIFPDPADGVSINAFSLEAGHPNGVCSGTSRRFTVTLKDPKLRYKVTTTFNQLLDLRITPTNHLEDNRSTDAMAIAVYNRKAAKYYSPEQLTQYTNQVSSLESGTSFYLNPFRTGPGDPAILGTVTVTAFDPTNPNAELSESAKLTFNVEIKASTNYVLDDIIVGNLLIADRNIGHKSRVRRDTNWDPIGGTEGRRDALNYNATPYPNGTASGDEELYITGKSDSEMNEEYSDKAKIWDHTTLTNEYSSNRLNYLTDLYNFWSKEHADNEKLYSPFYTDDDKEKWRLPYIEEEWWPLLNSERLIFTKWRVFLVSDIPMMKNGRSVPVMCWLHQTIGSMDNSYGSYVYIPYVTIYRDKDPDGKSISGTFLNQARDLVNFTRSAPDYASGYPVPTKHSVRLVRELTNEEIESYKHNYLGY